MYIGVCSVTRFLVEGSLSGLITQASTPFQTVDKEWPAWQVLASCLIVTETPFLLSMLLFYWLSRPWSTHVTSSTATVKLMHLRQNCTGKW